MKVTVVNCACPLINILFLKFTFSRIIVIVFTKLCALSICSYALVESTENSEI